MSELPRNPASARAASWDERLDGENGFDLARLIFATLVVFEHSFYLPYNNYSAEPLYILSGGQTDFGTLAVNGFFAISGFLIARSCLLTGNALRYFRKRLARIVPGFMLASLLGIFVFGPLGADDAAAFFREINPRGTLVRVLSLHQSSLSGTLQHNPMQGMLDGTLWTIKYEFDCYVFVAVLWALGLLKRGPVAALLIALTAALTLQRIGIFTPPVIDHGVPAILISSPDNWPRLFGFFFAGTAFYLWRDAIPKSPALLLVSALVLAFGMGIGGAEIAMLTGGVYCLFYAALSAGRTPRLFGRSVDLSYGIYLFGFPIQQLVIAASHQTIAPIALFLVSYPLTCILAYFSWTIVESPSLRWARGSRTSAAATAA